MNLILSGILYHVKDEIKSFAIFRNLILNVRSIYLFGTPAPKQSSRTVTST
jgi:hypothetical protein